MNSITKVTAGLAIGALLLPSLAFAQSQASINAKLKVGSQGQQVKLLQTLLASDPSIYPEGIISGYFGQLTAKAVRKFQQKNGLEQVGNVGPLTLAKLQALLASNPLETVSPTSTGTSTPSGFCAKVPPGHLIAPGWLKKMGGVAPIVPECQKLPSGITKKIGTGFGSSTGTSTSDKTAPTISSIDEDNIGTTTATIEWTTNEKATSKVYFGTSTPLNLSTSTSVSNSTLVKTHAIVLTGLTTNTDYFYVIESRDATGNTATSSERTFETD